MRVDQNLTKYNLRSAARKTVRKVPAKKTTRKGKAAAQKKAKPSGRSCNRPSMNIHRKPSERTIEATVTNLSQSAEVELAPELPAHPQPEENCASSCLFNMERYEQEKHPFDLETLLSPDDIERRYETQSLFEELISGESCDFLY